MEHRYPALEFEAEVGRDGTLRLPARIARRFRAGSRVTVRVTDGTVSALLRRRGVTEEEIERIAAAQLERRENAIEFLASEGALARHKGFSHRAAKLLRRRP